MARGVAGLGGVGRPSVVGFSREESAAVFDVIMETLNSLINSSSQINLIKNLFLTVLKGQKSPLGKDTTSKFEAMAREIITQVPLLPNKMYGLQLCSMLKALNKDTQNHNPNGIPFKVFSGRVLTPQMRRALEENVKQISERRGGGGGGGGGGGAVPAQHVAQEPAFAVLVQEQPPAAVSLSPADKREGARLIGLAREAREDSEGQNGCSSAGIHHALNAAIWGAKALRNTPSGFFELEILPSVDKMVTVLNDPAVFHNINKNNHLDCIRDLKTALDQHFPASDNIPLPVAVLRVAAETADALFESYFRVALNKKAPLLPYEIREAKLKILLNIIGLRSLEIAAPVAASRAMPAAASSAASPAASPVAELAVSPVVTLNPFSPVLALGVVSVGPGHADVPVNFAALDHSYSDDEKGADSEGDEPGVYHEPVAVVRGVGGELGRGSEGAAAAPGHQ